MGLLKQAFAAVRLTEGKEWIDIDSISLLKEEIAKEDAKLARMIPDWCKANAIIRIIKVRIEEIEDQS